MKHQIQCPECEFCFGYVEGAVYAEWLICPACEQGFKPKKKHNQIYTDFPKCQD